MWILGLKGLTEGQGNGKIGSLYRGSFSYIIHFTITGVKKIIRYTEDFVISRNLLYRGLLYQGSTV